MNLNPFTIAQLTGKTTSSVYYDTRTDQLKLSASPFLTMAGNDSYDLALSENKFRNKNSKKPHWKNTKDKKIAMRSAEQATTLVEESEHQPPKKTRKIIEISDDQRCCANTSDGSRCSLKRYKLSGELCFIHYQKTLDKKETQEPVVVERKIKKWYHLW
jgi:hypothetical protein